MYSTTEDREKRLKELKEELLTCPCPFEIAAEFAYDNERLREQLKNKH
jgi:hypothetical protein